MISNFKDLKYAQLLVSLFVLAGLFPALETRPGIALWTVAFWVVLLGALHAMQAHTRVRTAGRALAAVALVLSAVALFRDAQFTTGDWCWAVSSAAGFAFLAMTTVVVMLDVLGPARIDVDKILAAACAYVMIGLCYAFVFVLHGFIAPAVEPTPPGSGLAEYLYFSFVTLTTLGYGDATPCTHAARLLATSEAIVGQLYLTILVARLVGLHIAQSREAR